MIEALLLAAAEPVMTAIDAERAFAADAQKTEGLLGVGVVKPDAGLDRASLAAMTNVAALVMNSPDAYTVK